MALSSPLVNDLRAANLPTGYQWRVGSWVVPAPAQGMPSTSPLLLPADLVVDSVVIYLSL